MGCASSTPMIQTTGSEMLKAATHAASDATKTAEDAVEGVKESVGKSLETAKETVASAAESVKHEVENVVKEKTAQIDEAKNSLMEKLHFKSTNNDDDANGETNTNNMNANTFNIQEGKEKEMHDMKKTDMNELKTHLDENLNNNNNNDTVNATTINTSTTNVIMGNEAETEHMLTRTDTETDSLKTSTPEPEIEQALAKSNDNRTGNSDDDDDNPPTPKPTLAELENLTAEVLKQQQLQMQQENIINMAVNDILSANSTDDPLLTAEHENKKSSTTGIIISDTKTNDMKNDNEAPTTTTTTKTTTAIYNDSKTTIIDNMHKTSQIQTLSKGQHPAPLIPLTLATTDIAIATTAATKHTRLEPVLQTQVVNQKVPEERIKKSKFPKREEKSKIEKAAVPKTNSEIEEKRPRTTEWEKFADMLAQHRKFNPHDAFRRNGTLTKFGQVRDRPSYVGHHIRGFMDEDSSDTTSNFRSSPVNSQRSSARVGGRVQRLPNRPNTGNNRKNHHEFSNFNGGGRNQHLSRRNSNISGSTIGRKFDFNPNRSRVNAFISSVSSDLFIENSLQPTTANTQIPYAPTMITSHMYESVKSPANLRSHHSRSDMRQLPPWDLLERTKSLNQQEPYAQHQQHLYPDFDLDKQSALYRNETVNLTRESSNTSLFSNGSGGDINQSLLHKTSTLDLRPLSTNPPVKNTSSFLSTPRNSPFSIRKSYTDLYFSASNNKENKLQPPSVKTLKVPKSLYNLTDKGTHKVRRRCDVCCKMYSIK